MSTAPVTILGGGNTAFSVAANLTLVGACVTLCELPQFEEAIDPIEFDRAALVERADDLRSRTWLPNQLLRRRDDPQTHPSGLPAPPREPTKPSNQ